MCSSLSHLDKSVPTIGYVFATIRLLLLEDVIIEQELDESLDLEFIKLEGHIWSLLEPHIATEIVDSC